MTEIVELSQQEAIEVFDAIARDEHQWESTVQSALGTLGHRTSPIAIQGLHETSDIVHTLA